MVGYTWIRDDFRRRDLVVIKMLLFLQSASLVVLYPYLSLHMVELGLSMEQVTYINLLLALVEVITPILTGLVADKIGNFRLALSILTALNGVSSLVLSGLSSPSASQYLSIRMLLEVTRSSSVNLCEGAVALTLRERGGDYGLQRVWATVAAIVGGPLAGYILDLDLSEREGSKFFIVFLAFFCLRMISAALIFQLDLKFKKKSTEVLKYLSDLLNDEKVVFFLLTFGFLGTVWGLLETYFFFFLDDMGISKMNMGFSLAIGTLAGIPLTIFSGPLLAKCGQDLIVLSTLLIYAIRLYGYSISTSIKHILLLEVLKPLGNPLSMVTALYFIRSHADYHNMASLEGLFGSIYFGVGKGCGVFLGGILAGYFGYRMAFQIMSAVCIVFASFFYCFIFKNSKESKISIA